MSKLKNLLERRLAYAMTAVNIVKNSPVKGGNYMISSSDILDLEGLKAKFNRVNKEVVEEDPGYRADDIEVIEHDFTKAMNQCQDAEERMRQPDPNNPILFGSLGSSGSSGAGAGPRCVLPGQPKTYKNLFGDGQLSNNGFKDFNDYLFALKNRDTKRLMNAGSGMSEGVPSEGGFLVPSQFAGLFLDKTFEESIILPGCYAYPMTTKTLTVPGFDSSDHSDGAIFGGVKAFWKGESDNNNIQIPRTRQLELNAKTLVLLTAATMQLQEDAPNFWPTLEQGFARAASFEVDYSLINGNGVGQPLGFLNHASVIEVSKTAAQTAVTISLNNVLEMMSRLHPACWSSAVWIAHPSTLPQLTKLYFTAGTEGSLVNAFTFSSGSGGYSLYGKPLYFTKKASQLGTKGDLMLIDRSQYVVGVRKNITMDMSEHVYFTTLEKAYRTVMRIDGQPAWDKPVQPRNGTDTLSWCVALESRT